jgi:hypothetical protein
LPGRIERNTIVPSSPVFPERSTGPAVSTLTPVTGLPLLSVTSTVTASVVLLPRDGVAVPAPRDGGVGGEPVAGGCGACAAAVTTANAQVKDKGRNLIDLM